MAHQESYTVTTEQVNPVESDMYVTIEQANTLQTWIEIMSDVAPSAQLKINSANVALFNLLKQSGFKETTTDGETYVLLTREDSSLIKVWVDKFNEDMPFQEYMRMIRANATAK